jgi:RNA polymerase sigma-70 factor (ECF subfamily)
VHGRRHVARTLIAWSHAGARIPGAGIRPVVVNGQPGALLLDGSGRLISVMALDIWGGAVQSVRSMINPEKLGHLGPVADLGELLRAGRK